MKARIVSVAFVVALLSVRAAAPAPSDAASVPEEFEPLYRELEQTLRVAQQKFPFAAQGALPLVAPGLICAGSGFGPAEEASPRWRDLLATLDAFKAAGMNAVSVMIAAPDLSLGDPQPLLTFYRRLAQQVHARGMKLYVEHFDNPPFSPHAHQGWTDTPADRKRFLAMRAREAGLIYREIQPDFLSLITEPGTMSRWTKLTFSPDELADWVGEVRAELKRGEGGAGTRLGAGAPTWEPEDFVLKLARQRAVDYIDIHLYALELDAEDQLARFAARMRQLRELRPDLAVTIGETWLYKHGAREPKGMLNRDAYFRDNFSFWSPLDQRFMRLLLGLAQRENIAVIAPYFSQHFFAYYTFGDAESARLPPWPASVFSSWEKALPAIRRGELSATGQAMKAMLRAKP